MWGAEPDPFERSGLFSSGELIIKTFPGFCPRHYSILPVISMEIRYNLTNPDSYKMGVFSRAGLKFLQSRL